MFSWWLEIGNVVLVNGTWSGASFCNTPSQMDRVWWTSDCSDNTRRDLSNYWLYTSVRAGMGESVSRHLKHNPSGRWPVPGNGGLIAIYWSILDRSYGMVSLGALARTWLGLVSIDLPLGIYDYVFCNLYKSKNIAVSTGVGHWLPVGADGGRRPRLCPSLANS